jgi:hypothetical protein
MAKKRGKPSRGAGREEGLRAAVESCAVTLMDSARLCRDLARQREGVVTPWEEIVGAMDRIAVNTKVLEGLRANAADAATEQQEDTKDDREGAAGSKG